MLLKDYVMIVTGAVHHVKSQRQTIQGFSQQRVDELLKGEHKCMLWLIGYCIVAM